MYKNTSLEEISDLIIASTPVVPVSLCLALKSSCVSLDASTVANARLSSKLL